MADPGHAFKYGTTIRVAAERDVYPRRCEGRGDRLLRSQDRAPRAGAPRGVAGGGRGCRRRALSRPIAFRSWPRGMICSYVVTEQPLPLPEAYRNARFHVYQLPSATALQRYMSHAALQTITCPDFVGSKRWSGGHRMTVYAWARRRAFPRLPRARSALLRRHATTRACWRTATGSRRPDAADAAAAARARRIEQRALHARPRRQGLRRAASTSSCSTSATAAAPSTCRAASTTPG